MTAALPQVGVCVPAYRNPSGVAALLDRIAAQDWPAERLHVVVAVDGGDPATVAAADRPGVTVLQPPAGGSYAARNAALDALPDDVELVLFTDDDCLPAPGWVRSHVEALRTAELSGGAIDVTLSRRPSPAEYVDKNRHLQQEIYVAYEHYAATANLGVRREVLRTMRFDGSLRTGGDVEFGRRAHAAGFRLVYAPDALVEHPARRTTRELVGKIRRICGGMSAQAARWQGREVRRARLRRALARQARRQGVSAGLWWDARMVALEWYCQWLLVRSAVRYGARVVR